MRLIIFCLAGLVFTQVLYQVYMLVGGFSLGFSWPLGLVGVAGGFYVWAHS